MTAAQVRAPGRRRMRVGFRAVIDPHGFTGGQKVQVTSRASSSLPTKGKRACALRSYRRQGRFNLHGPTDGSTGQDLHHRNDGRARPPTISINQSTKKILVDTLPPTLRSSKKGGGPERQVDRVLGEQVVVSWEILGNESRPEYPTSWNTRSVGTGFGSASSARRRMGGRQGEIPHYEQRPHCCAHESNRPGSSNRRWRPKLRWRSGGYCLESVTTSMQVPRPDKTIAPPAAYLPVTPTPPRTQSEHSVTAPPTRAKRSLACRRTTLGRIPTTYSSQHQACRMRNSDRTKQTRFSRGAAKPTPPRGLIF